MGRLGKRTLHPGSFEAERANDARHPAPLDAAGRQPEEGGQLTAYYTRRDSRATWRPYMPAILAPAIGIDPRKMPRDAEMSRLFEVRAR